jgi:hypothetical protein
LIPASTVSFATFRSASAISPSVTVVIDVRDVLVCM